jgi:predicted RNA-binding Zn-ribbon protein involved in translation (DUF1610 family)
MDAAVPASVIACTQCGGELHPEEGQIFITCPFCGSTVYLDRSQVVFHWYLAPTLDQPKARASLASWMAGNQTVKDLDRKARLTGESFEYFPLWYFKRRLSDGREEILLEPAAATSVTELRRLNLPAGDLKKYDTSLDSQARTPTVPLDAAMRWLADRQIPSEEVVERMLVHIPLYTFKYDFNGQAYTAIIEAGTGGVFANIYPAKAEAPYLLAGGLTALVYLSLALIPIISASVNRAAGAATGLALCSVLGLVAAPILFAIAAWVASRV